jgi:ParG
MTMSVLKTKPAGAKRDARIEKMRNNLTNQKPTRALNLVIDASLLKRFKIQVATADTSMTDVITNMIEDYVKS